MSVSGDSKLDNSGWSLHCKHIIKEKAECGKGMLMFSFDASYITYKLRIRSSL